MDLLAIVSASSLQLALYVFAFILAILWLLLPFAVFGVKKLIRRETHALAALLEETNGLLRAMSPSATLAVPASTTPGATLCHDRISHVWDARLGKKQRCLRCEVARSAA